MNDDLPKILPSLLPRLWRFGLRLTANEADAEDLVHRACLRALERSHQLRPDSSALSWLFSIMHSIWLNELRSRQIRRQAGFEWDDDAVEAIADPNAVNPENALFYRQVIAAVNALPDAQRAVMLLVAVEGLSYQEAADILDIPMGTVMSRLARARMTIGERFNRASSKQNPEKRHERE
jgi:RNA polymerase sigma-70 factor (ECF subfamily)